jgi:hypothetical protein
MRRRAASLLFFASLACAACGGSSSSEVGGSDGGGTAEDAAQTDGTVPSNGEDSGQPSSDEDSGQPSSGEDSGTPTNDEDSGTSTSNDDAGGNDGGDADVDSGELHDAGTDATTPEHDAGSELDASQPVDAGEPDAPDAGSELDASLPVDASEPDAARELDSGTDSGSQEKDSGVDAGPPPPETLTVTTTGWGIVTASGSTLSCPTGCTATYPKGTSVTLTATPSLGQTLTGWSGGTCSGASTTCTFSLDAATTVNAAFSTVYPPMATKVDESYDCTLSIPFGGLDQPATLSVTSQGGPPLQVPPGATFSMPLFQTVATVPASVVNTAVADSCTSVSGSVTVIDIDATEGTTIQTVDPVTGAPPNSYQFGPIALTQNTPIVLSLPTSPATIGTFTAGTASPIQFTPGAEVTSLSASLTFTCLGVSVPGSLTCTVAKPATAFATTTVQP